RRARLSPFSPPAATPCALALSLHDALPIWPKPPLERPMSLEERPSTVSTAPASSSGFTRAWGLPCRARPGNSLPSGFRLKRKIRSEEHTSELQSRFDVVCRLVRDKDNKQQQ